MCDVPVCFKPGIIATLAVALVCDLPRTCPITLLMNCVSWKSWSASSGENDISFSGWFQSWAVACQVIRVTGERREGCDVMWEITMGRRRERTRWSPVDLLHHQGGRVRSRRNSTSAVVAKLQPKVIEKELISEFSCVEAEQLEELSNGFTKIR